MLHLCCFTVWIVFLKYFFFHKTVTAELSETDHRPPSGTQRMLSQIFPCDKYFFFADISQKALNKRHVGRFCAALLPKAARWSKELSCCGVENYRVTFHPPSSVLHSSQPLFRTRAQPSAAAPLLRRSLSLTFLQLCFTSDPKERPCNVLTVASAA